MKNQVLKMFLFAFAVLSIAVSSIPFAYAYGEKNEKCGDNAYWEYDYETKTLTISGTGAMYDFKYETDAPWFAHTIEKVVVEEGISKIGNSAFNHSHDTITNVDLPSTLLIIGSGAFSYCTSLKEIELPINLACIGSKAFAFCENLNKVTFPDNLIFIGEGAFSRVPFNETKTLTLNCETIDRGAFTDCGIESLHLGEAVSEIKADAFRCCDNLREITFMGESVNVGFGAFAQCDNLTKLTFCDLEQNIKTGSTRLDDNSFGHCVSPIEIYFGKNNTVLVEFGAFSCTENIKLTGYLDEVVASDNIGNLLFSDGFAVSLAKEKGYIPIQILCIVGGLLAISTIVVAIIFIRKKHKKKKQSKLQSKSTIEYSDCK